MSDLSITDKIASTWLGKKISGSEEYNPSLLVAVPRAENRSQYNMVNFHFAAGMSGMLMNSLR